VRQLPIVPSFCQSFEVESHWLWQWKFRLFDRKVRFDPSKSGWPWVPERRWVAPTALVILAFRAWRRNQHALLLAPTCCSTELVLGAGGMPVTQWCSASNSILIPTSPPWRRSRHAVRLTAGSGRSPLLDYLALDWVRPTHRILWPGQSSLSAWLRRRQSVESQLRPALGRG
jgi:hypothetical protein